ncbi:MAG: hypothetical protein R6U98_05345 [Pirellulaceae bacterium]
MTKTRMNDECRMTNDETVEQPTLIAHGSTLGSLIQLRKIRAGDDVQQRYGFKLAFTRELYFRDCARDDIFQAVDDLPILAHLPEKVAHDFPYFPVNDRGHHPVFLPRCLISYPTFAPSCQALAPCSSRRGVPCLFAIATESPGPSQKASPGHLSPVAGPAQERVLSHDGWRRFLYGPDAWGHSVVFSEKI